MFERWTDELKDRLRQLTLELAGPRAEALRALPKPANEFGVDSFGFDPEFALSAVAPFAWLYRRHMEKESALVLPFAREAISETERARLGSRMAARRRITT